MSIRLAGLLSDSNIVKMKALEDKMLKHPQYKDFCQFKSSYEMARLSPHPRSQALYQWFATLLAFVRACIYRGTPRGLISSWFDCVLQVNGTKFYGLRAGPGDKRARACNPSVAEKTCVGTCIPPLTLTNYFYPRPSMTIDETAEAMVPFYMQLYGSPMVAVAKARGVTAGPIFNTTLRTQSKYAALMARPAVKALVAKLDTVGGAGVDPYEVHDTLVCANMVRAQTCAAVAGCAWNTTACVASSEAVLLSKFVRVYTLSDGSGLGS